MKSLAKEQRRTLSDFLSNIGVVWVGGGIVGPLLSGQADSLLAKSMLWGFVPGMIFLGAALWVGKR